MFVDASENKSSCFKEFLLLSGLKKCNFTLASNLANPFVNFSYSTGNSFQIQIEHQPILPLYWFNIYGIIMAYSLTNLKIALFCFFSDS